MQDKKQKIPKNASAQTQRFKILRYLKVKKNKGATIREISSQLAILDARKRISEIRQRGIKIPDVWEHWLDEYGIQHRVKRYFYGGGGHENAL